MVVRQNGGHRVLAVAALIVAPLTAGTQPTSSVPIVIDQVQLAEAGRPGGSAEAMVTARNTGKVTIIAWGVAGDVRYSNGETRRIGVSTDTYEALPVPETPPLPPDRSKRIPPGGIAVLSTSFPALLPEASATGAAALPTFAVFEDDTAVGDEREIDRVFERRRLNLRVWRIADETFAAALARGLNNDQAFAEIMKALQDAGDEVRNSMAASILSRTLGRSRTPQAYEHLRAEIVRRRAAAERHSERKR